MGERRNVPQTQSPFFFEELTGATGQTLVIYLVFLILDSVLGKQGANTKQARVEANELVCLTCDLIWMSRRPMHTYDLQMLLSKPPREAFHCIWLVNFPRSLQGCSK